MALTEQAGRSLMVTARAELKRKEMVAARQSFMMAIWRGNFGRWPKISHNVRERQIEHDKFDGKKGWINREKSQLRCTPDVQVVVFFEIAAVGVQHSASLSAQK
jgi:hypothetical protein